MFGHIASEVVLIHMFGFDVADEVIHAVVGQMPAMDFESPVAAAEVDTTLGAPPPADAYELAYGHYAEQAGVEGAVGNTPDGAPAVDKMAELTPEEQTAALGEMGDEQFQEVLAQVPDGDRAKLETLIGNCTDPRRKLQLWQKYHNTMNQREVDEAAPEEEVGEDPDRMKERMRFEGIAKTTESEIEDDIAAFEKSGKELTLEDVDKLIERKELESDIEMKYGLNITTVGGTRENGERILWSKEELEVVRDSLGQVPESIMSDRNVISELRRDAANAAGDNAINDPNGGIITMYDNGAKVTPDDKRESGDPGLDETTTYMEHVMLHEIGHSAHNQNLDKHLPVFDKATEHREGSEHAEYFAQHFKNALLRPEYYATYALDEPQQQLADAKKALEKNPSDPALQAAVDFAEKDMKGYQTMYNHMRNEVFQANKYEDAYATQLTEQEQVEFRAKAARLSTPEQVGRLAEEYGLEVIDRDALVERDEPAAP